MKNKEYPLKTKTKPFLKRESYLPYVAVLAVITFVVFFNSLSNDFTKWDDNDYVTENPYIEDLSFGGIKQLFEVYVSCHYHPLTLLSLSVDYHIWGFNPKGYILTNILIHILNVLLVFFLFSRLANNPKIAFVTALLFAIHPMRVESVVWVSERKDVLFLFFYLAALWLYAHMRTGKFEIRKYAGVIILFLLSLLAKAAAVTLPLALLLIDFYKERKDFKRMIVEKLPLLAISLLFGMVAIDAQSTAEPNIFPLQQHFFMASYAVSFYLIKFFAPFHQSAITPFPELIDGLLPMKYYISVLVLPLVLICFFIKGNYRRLLVFSLSFFLLPLLPLLIKFPIGPAYLAERYTYLPHIGIAFLIGHLMVYLQSIKKFKMLAAILLFAVAIFFSYRTIERNKVWRNNQSLFEDVVRKDARVTIAHQNLGNTFFEAGLFYKALESYNEAIMLSPDLVQAYQGRGLTCFNIGDYFCAIESFSKVLENDNENTIVLLSRAQSYVNTFQFKKALTDFDTLLEIDTRNAQALNNRGAVYYNMGRPLRALQDFQQAIDIDPTNPMSFFNRAMLMEQINNYNQAFSDYSKAIELNPFLYQAHNARGVLRGRYMNDIEGALEDVNAALVLEPEMIDALKNKAYILFLKGDTLQACHHWQQLFERGKTSVVKFISAYCINE